MHLYYSFYCFSRFLSGHRDGSGFDVWCGSCNVYRDIFLSSLRWWTWSKGIFDNFTHWVSETSWCPLLLLSVVCQPGQLRQITLNAQKITLWIEWFQLIIFYYRGQLAQSLKPRRIQISFSWTRPKRYPTFWNIFQTSVWQRDWDHAAQALVGKRTRQENTSTKSAMTQTSICFGTTFIRHKQDGKLLWISTPAKLDLALLESRPLLQRGPTTYDPLLHTDRRKYSEARNNRLTWFPLNQ